MGKTPWLVKFNQDDKCSCILQSVLDEGMSFKIKLPKLFLRKAFHYFTLMVGYLDVVNIPYLCIIPSHTHYGTSHLSSSQRRFFTCHHPHRTLIVSSLQKILDVYLFGGQEIYHGLQRKLWILNILCGQLLASKDNSIFYVLTLDS